MSLQPTEASLLACCACRSWAAALAATGPYNSLDEIIEAARHLWWQQVGQHYRCSRSANLSVQLAAAVFPGAGMRFNSHHPAAQLEELHCLPGSQELRSCLLPAKPRHATSSLPTDACHGLAGGLCRTPTHRGPGGAAQEVWWRVWRNEPGRAGGGGRGGRGSAAGGQGADAEVGEPCQSV